MTRPTRTLVLMFGPPAVGKMAVGQELSALTRIPLFHNHLSIEAVLPVFDFGSPPFNRLVRDFRSHMFAEVAESSLPGLIFTYVWAFDQPSDLKFVTELKDVFESRGARTVFVELVADLETRLERNGTTARLMAKPSKRDVTASSERLRALGEQYQLDSMGLFPFDNHLRIDNSRLSVSAVAHQIADHFELPTHAPVSLTESRHSEGEDD